MIKNLLENSVYSLDVKKAAENLKKSLKLCNLNEKKILVTGCNGLIGAAFVHLLMELAENYNITVYLATRDTKKTEEIFDVKNHAELKVLEYDALKKLSGEILNLDVDYIIHAAGNTTPKLITEQPVQTMGANIFGLEQFLQMMASKTKKKCRLLFVSSSEVYGQLENHNENQPIEENESGYLDLLNPRNSYAMAKRAGETLCAAYKSQYNVDSVIARPGHVFGPTASESDNRVGSSFMYQAARGESLVLKSDGQQLRSYCYSLDCATALIAILLNGQNGQAYNISNKNGIITIRQLAEYFSKSGNCKIEFSLPQESEKRAFNQMKNSSLNSQKIENLGWKALFSIEESVNHSVEIARKLTEK